MLSRFSPKIRIASLFELNLWKAGLSGKIGLDTIGKDMNGKLAVISGGTRGIGRAVLKAFARLDFGLVTCSRSERSLDELRMAFDSEYPGIELHGIVADLAIRKDVDAFSGYVQTLGHPVEVLVNNAGRFLPGSVHAEEEGNLEQMISTNLYSAYHLTRALIPGMLRARSGHIFNMCSTASIIPYLNGGSYCISKFALYGMTKMLREELKESGIRVTAILPGATLTDSWAGTDLPPDRFMKPEDVAAVVTNAYVLSQSAVVEEILMRPQLGDI